MSIAILKIRQFRASLPADFGALISVGKTKRKSDLYFKNSSPENYFKDIQSPYKLPSADKRLFMIKRAENEICFSGHYSKWMLVEWVQKLKEFLFPERVFILYIKYKDLK